MKTTIRYWQQLVVILTAAVILGGCAPRGNTGSRIDPYRSTEADAESGRALLPALLEASDETAERLAVELASIDDIRQLNSKAVLELGDLYNKTYTTPTSDFELIQRRIRGRLFNSPVIRDHFILLESRQRQDRELDRVVGALGNTARYDPALTYVLQGDFLEANRGARRQYYFEFKLTNVATRKIVFLKSFDLAQVR